MKLGGKRKGSGRRSFPEPLKRTTVMLPDSDIDAARTAGSGSVSAGVRVAIGVMRAVDLGRVKEGNDEA